MTCLSLSSLHTLHVWGPISDYSEILLRKLHPNSCRAWSGCMVWLLCSFHWAVTADVDIHGYQINQNGREMKPQKTFQAFCIQPFKGIYQFLSWTCSWSVGHAHGHGEENVKIMKRNSCWGTNYTKALAVSEFQADIHAVEVLKTKPSPAISRGVKFIPKGYALRERSPKKQMICGYVSL